MNIAVFGEKSPSRDVGKHDSLVTLNTEMVSLVLLSVFYCAPLLFVVGLEFWERILILLRS